MTPERAKLEVRYIEGDDLWESGEPGWYWGEVINDYDDLGDTVGPFDTEEEARKDMEECRI